MVLNLPNVMETDNLFKNSPEENQVLKNQGQKDIPEDDNNDDTQPTKELFFNADARVFLSRDETLAVTFKIPHDFNSITSFEIILITGGTDASANFDIYTTYGKVGETYTTHADSDTSSTYNVTTDKLTAIDISSIIGNDIEAEDIGYARIVNKEIGWDILIFGLRIRYT